MTWNIWLLFGSTEMAFAESLSMAFFPISTIGKMLWLLYPLSVIADVRGGIVSAPTSVGVLFAYF